MDTGIEQNITQDVEKQDALPPLPFTYQRVENPTQAQYKEWRIVPIIFEGKASEPKTDEEIIEDVRKQHEGKQWYTTEYWRKKGQPQEQLECHVNGQQITIYNFNKDKQFTDEHITRTQRAVQKLAVRFPKVLETIRWVLIEDVQPPSLLADDELYPTNGTAMREHRAFRFMPRGLELIPHRVAGTSNFEGTFVHELGHLMEDEFHQEWREKFQWEWCMDDKENFEIRKAQNGENRWFNKQTGKMSPQGQYPLQPDQCVTFYGRQNMGEDICESLVAYIYDPDTLKKIAPDKFDILSSHDNQSSRPEVGISRVPKEKIALPQIKPEEIPYFIQEPEQS